MYDTSGLILESEKSNLAPSDRSAFSYKGSHSRKVCISAVVNSLSLLYGHTLRESGHLFRFDLVHPTICLSVPTYLIIQH